MPQHVAIILDGNGRWAKSKGMPRNYGHVQGAKTVEVILSSSNRDLSPITRTHMLFFAAVLRQVFI